MTATRAELEDLTLRFTDGLVAEKHTYAKADVPRLEPRR